MGDDIVERVKLFLEAYRTALTLKAPKENRVLDQWVPPLRGKVNLNFDVGFRHSESFQDAMVARNKDGVCEP